MKESKESDSKPYLIGLVIFIVITTILLLIEWYITAFVIFMVYIGIHMQHSTFLPLYIDIEGAFGVEFKIEGKKSEYSFKKLTGEYVVPSGTNFAGDIHINNVSYRNALPINLNVFGGWNYSAPGGHGVVTGPTIIGFITGAWGRYNHEFRIK